MSIIDLTLHQAEADTRPCTCTMPTGEHTVTCPCATHAAHVGDTVHEDDFTAEHVEQDVSLPVPLLQIGERALQILVAHEQVDLGRRQAALNGLAELATLGINDDFDYDERMPVGDGTAYAIQMGLSWLLDQTNAALTVATAEPLPLDLSQLQPIAA
jgi:hypothetical protein